MVEFVINSRLNSATGHTPFELLYSYMPNFTIPTGHPTAIPLVDKCLQHLQTLCIDAEAALHLSKKHMQTDKEQCHKPYTFQVGDKVWLQAKQIKIHQQFVKLSPKQLGPFKVTEVSSEIDYRLALPPAVRIHDVFHVDCLSPYKGHGINGFKPPHPVPVTVDGKEEYKVDHIRDSKLFGHSQMPCLLEWLWRRTRHLGARTELEAHPCQVGRVPCLESRCTSYNKCIVIHILALATSKFAHFNQCRHQPLRRGVMSQMLA